jgi:hypothetical protein
MPPNERVRMDDRQNAAPVDPSRQDHQRDPGRSIGPPRFHLPFDVERQLLAEKQVFSREAGSRSGRNRDESQPIGRDAMVRNTPHPRELVMGKDPTRRRALANSVVRLPGMLVGSGFCASVAGESTGHQNPAAQGTLRLRGFQTYLYGRLFDRRTVGLAVDIHCRPLQQPREAGCCELLPPVRRAAVAAGASIVLLAHVFQQAQSIPVWPKRQLEVLRPRSREDLGVVDGDAVLKLIPFTS